MKSSITSNANLDFSFWSCVVKHFFLPESALVSAYPRLFAASKATFILFLFLGNTKVSSHVPKLGLDSAYVL